MNMAESIGLWHPKEVKFFEKMKGLMAPFILEKKDEL
jgi:hypothetical protein